MVSQRDAGKRDDFLTDQLPHRVLPAAVSSDFVVDEETERAKAEDNSRVTIGGIITGKVISLDFQPFLYCSDIFFTKNFCKLFQKYAAASYIPIIRRQN